jgi:flagellar biosynthesis protein FliP
MIRLVIGLILVMSAVGGMEDPDNSLLLLVAFASAGLFIMASGVKRMNQDDEF